MFLEQGKNFYLFFSLSQKLCNVSASDDIVVFVRKIHTARAHRSQPVKTKLAGEEYELT